MTTTSTKWRTQIEQKHLISQTTSILLQRHNWAPLLHPLFSPRKQQHLTPHVFFQILKNTSNTNPHVSLSFFNWVKSNIPHFTPDLHSQCHLINVALGSGLTRTERSILDSLVKTHHPSVLAQAMVDSCKGGKDRNFIEFRAFDFVLECYCRNGLFVDALIVFGVMRVNGFVPCVGACNALLDVLERNGEVRLAWCVYCAMIRGGVLPDNLTWCLVGRILRKAGKFERIVAFLAEGICCNSVMYSAAVDWYCKNGDFVAAFDRVNEMQERSIALGFATFASILDGACKSENHDVIERAMKIMVDKGLLPRCPTSECDQVIQKLCNLGFVNAVVMFFSRARDKNIELHDSTYMFMLNALSRAGRLQDSISLYRLTIDKGILMKESASQALVDLICQENQFKEGYITLRDIIGRGFKPRMTNLSRYIYLRCTKHQWREAEELLDVVIKNELVLSDKLCYCSMVQHYCSRRQMNKALALHNKLVQLQVNLDVKTYNSLLNGLLRLGRVEEAMSIFYHMKAFKLVNSTSFSVGIRWLCQAKEMRRAMELHDEMLQTGHKPDQATYKKLIFGFEQ